MEVVPGFAVGVVEAGEAAAFGAEQKAGLAEDVREGEDEPGIFGDDVGGDEIDFGELVGDGASVDAAVGVDVVEAVEQLGGGFDLDADEAGARAVEKQVPRLGSLSPGFGGDNGCEMGGVEDDVVAFAVAEGLGDAEAVAGGGEGEGEFGDFSAAFGGEFAFEGSEKPGSETLGSLGEAQFASAGRAFRHLGSSAGLGLVLGSRFSGLGSWVLGVGCWVSGFWFLVRFRMLGFGLENCLKNEKRRMPGIGCAFFYSI